MGLIDLCLERTTQQGFAPDTITTRQLAEKVIYLYWPQVLPYGRGREAGVLLQNTGRRQAEMVALIARFRSAFPNDPLLPIERARSSDGSGFRALVDEVEWKLIEMPLPRLQSIGSTAVSFLYDISWTETIPVATVRAYQRGGSSDFDNRIRLKAGVGDQLVQLNGLIRPLLYRQWAELVAKMNQLEAYRLEEFLFGTMRVSTDPVRRSLVELQNHRCFYCEERIERQPVVDHFIPWSRYPDSNLANLVAAHAACNGRKRDFLAATPHVERWGVRLVGKERSQLEDMAKRSAWPWRPETSCSVGRGIYLRLPAEATLWLSGDQFEAPEFVRLRQALSRA